MFLAEFTICPHNLTLYIVTSRDNDTSADESYRRKISREQAFDQDISSGAEDRHPKIRSDDRSLLSKVGTSLDEDLSLIDNQQPPFGTLDSFEFSNHNNSKDDTRSKSPNKSLNTSGPKPSKIPYLRSRSPSMSRPGSAEPKSRSNSTSRSQPGSQANSRPSSPDSQNRSRPRQKNKGRTLPLTPSKRQASVSQSRSRSSSPGTYLSNGRSSSIPRPVSSSGSPRAAPRKSLTNHNTQQNTIYNSLSQEERDLDQAARLLADNDDNEVASLTSSVESNTRKLKQKNKNNRPRPASTGNVKPQVSRSKSEATIDLGRPSSAKQAKDLSSSRSTTPKSFRIRSQSTTALLPGKQPLRAMHDAMEEGEEGN